MMLNLDLKQKVHRYCLDIIEEKLATIQKEFRLYQDSADNETKSTAGDKHDTGKAMMQMEQEKLGNQLKELINSKQILGSINPGILHKKIQFGSLVRTDSGLFYIAISLGKIRLELQEVFILSIQTPLGKLMLNKGIGESFSLNGKIYSVKEVC